MVASIIGPSACETQTFSPFAALHLSPVERKDLSVQVLVRTEPVVRLAARYPVSRTFAYQQARKASEALDATFEEPPESGERVLFQLPVTKNWLRQFILAQVLVGLHDEIYQGHRPVLVGLDARSLYGYLLADEDPADETTRGVHLLDLETQGLSPDRTIADGGRGLRAGQAAARRAEATAVELARDIRLLSDWMQGDILALAGLDVAERFQIWPSLVHQVAELQGLDPNQPAYWQREGALRKNLGCLLDPVRQAVRDIQAATPRASSLVENLNGRLRSYFFLRRQIGHGYLDLLRFFLNHRRFLRSEVSERVGKTPAQLLTGQPHPHWLELLGFTRFQRN